MITGRRVQLADLAALARAATSGARIAWLVGAEGVGKSTLAGAAAAASGLPILQLDAYPEDLSKPMATVLDLAEQLGVELGDRPSALSQYEKLLSVDQRSADRLFNLIFP